MVSIGKVITASAATVGITFLILSFAKMGVFKTVGVSSAIGIGVAYLAGVTLLPAILVACRTTRLGQAASRADGSVLAALRDPYRAQAGAASGGQPAGAGHPGRPARPSRATTTTTARWCSQDAPSSIGYAALERHFPINQAIPEYILVQSPRDLRSPQALADLEQMASRVAQLPDVVARQRHHPAAGRGAPGVPGRRSRRASSATGWPTARPRSIERTADLNRLATGANTLADNLGDVRAQVNQMAPSIQSLIDAFSSMQTKYGGDKLVRDVDDRRQAGQTAQPAR